MVEKIEKLKTDSEHAILPMGHRRVLHDRQVCGYVARSAKSVATLRESHTRTAARSVRPRQVPCHLLG